VIRITTTGSGFLRGSCVTFLPNYVRIGCVGLVCVPANKQTN